MCIKLTEYPKYPTMQRSSRTQNMHVKTQWDLFNSKNIVRTACLVLLEAYYSYPNLPDIPISVLKCFKHSLPKIRKF